MQNKKIYLLALLLLVCILSMQTISATEDTGNNEVISANNDKELNLEKNQYDDVSISDDNSEINLEENNYNYKVSESGTDKIKASNEDPLSFNDLNTAINNNTNSTIYLPTNNYYKYDASEEELVFGININRNLTIYGNEVTIDGSNMARIFDVDEHVTVKFYNIKFINGKADYGGAIWGGNAYGCIFINNTAEFAGGAIYQGNAYDCTFTENEANWSGGAISNGNAYNSTFNKNKALSWDGGAINNGNATNCNFTQNYAKSNGGAIYQGNAYNSTFIENKAKQEGGAIYDGNATNCTFKGNNATNGGAMYEGTACLCRFNRDTTKDTEIIPAIINVLNYTSPYKSDEKLKFNLTANDMVFDGFNTTINIYKDRQLYTTVYALSGEGWIVDLVPGEYTAVLSLTDYPEEKPSNATITVLKGNTIVNITPITNVNIGEEVTINYTTNSNGTVTIKVNGQSITDKKFTPTKEGTYNITIEIAENDYYTAGYNETTFNAEKTNTTIEIKPIPNVVVGEEVTINYTTNSNGTAKIKVNGEEISGNKFTPTKEGTYNITIEIAENDYYTAATNSTTFTAEKLTSKITVKPITTTYNVAKNLIITLKDSNGKAIKKAKITVNLGHSKKYTTNDNGQFKINVGTLTPKTYNAKITYAGSDIFNGSTASVKVTVKKAKPKITAKSAIFKLKVKTKKYTAYFKDNKNKALKNTKVSLKVHGKTYITKTNSKGQGIFKISNLKKKGSYIGVITIPSNHYYNKVSKKVKITVKQ